MGGMDAQSVVFDEYDTSFERQVSEADKHARRVGTPVVVDKRPRQGLEQFARRHVVTDEHLTGGLSDDWYVFARDPRVPDEDGKVWQLEGVEIFRFTMGFDSAKVPARPPVLVTLRWGERAVQRWAREHLLLDGWTVYRRRADALRGKGGKWVATETLVRTGER